MTRCPSPSGPCRWTRSKLRLDSSEPRDLDRRARARVPGAAARTADLDADDAQEEDRRTERNGYTAVEPVVTVCPALSDRVRGRRC
jgi:hypothetical protein